MSEEQKKCFECGSTDDLHEHHVVPRVKGGTKTVALCVRCHGLVHGRNMLNHRELTIEGLNKAKQSGKKLGRPAKAQENQDLILRLKGQGWKAKQIADHLSISIHTVYKKIQLNKKMRVDDIKTIHYVDKKEQTNKMNELLLLEKKEAEVRKQEELSVKRKRIECVYNKLALSNPRHIVTIQELSEKLNIEYKEVYSLIGDQVSSEMRQRNIELKQEIYEFVTCLRKFKKMSCVDLADYFNNNDIKKPTGHGWGEGEWNGSSIQKILKEFDEK
jgi:transposase